MTTVLFGDLPARMLLVEWDRARTIVHLRAADPADTTALTEHSRTAVDEHGMPLSHLASLSGGTGVETHVTHVFDGVPAERLVLLDSAGKPAITIDVEP